MQIFQFFGHANSAQPERDFTIYIRLTEPDQQSMRLSCPNRC